MTFQNLQSNPISFRTKLSKIFFTATAILFLSSINLKGQCGTSCSSLPPDPGMVLAMYSGDPVAVASGGTTYACPFAQIPFFLSPYGGASGCTTINATFNGGFSFGGGGGVDSGGGTLEVGASGYGGTFCIYVTCAETGQEIIQTHYAPIYVPTVDIQLASSFVCGQTATFVANFSSPYEPDTGNFLWDVISTSPNTTVTVVSQSYNQLQVTIDGTDPIQVNYENFASNVYCGGSYGGLTALPWSAAAVPQPPSETLIATPIENSICTGDATTVNVSGANPAGQYEWESRNIGDPSWTNLGVGTDQMSTGVLSQGKEFRVRYVTGCGETAWTSTTVEVSSLSLPPDDVCESMSTSLTASGGSGSATYEWESKNSSGATWSSESETSATLSTGALSQDKDYRVRVVGGCTDWATATVSILPDPTASPSGDNSGVTQTNYTFTTPPIAGATYAWTLDGGTGSSTTNSISAQWTTAGTKNVCVTVTSSDGCQNNACHPITLILLPVELILFDAEESMRGVELTWSTATEQNNSHFVIEHSLDGNIFRSVGTVRGQGNAAERHDYQFNHENPTFGKNYYRLAQYDFDGSMEYSETRILDIRNVKKNAINLYPNPVISGENIQVNIRLAQENSAGTLEVYDMSGRIVFTNNIYLESGNNELLVSPDQLPNGILMVKVKLDNGTQLSGKLIKQR